MNINYIYMHTFKKKTFHPYLDCMYPKDRELDLDFLEDNLEIISYKHLIL